MLKRLTYSVAATQGECYLSKEVPYEETYGCEAATFCLQPQTNLPDPGPQGQEEMSHNI